MILWAILAYVAHGAIFPPYALTTNVIDSCVNSEFNILWQPASSDTEIVNYELEFALNGKGDWKVYDGAIYGHEHSGVVNEIQAVSSMADVGEMITSGYFQLSFATTGVIQKDPNTKSVTELLSFDASAAQVMEALMKLDSIENVNVDRNGPTAQGGYTWIITFFEIGSASEFPRIELFSENLNGVWTKTSDQITIQRIQTQNRDGQNTCKGSCLHALSGFEAGKQYVFRMRAMDSQNRTSVWSHISEPVKMCNKNSPRQPFGLEMESRTRFYISVKWVTDPQLLNNGYYELAQKCNQHQWNIVHDYIKPTPVYTMVSSTKLSPNTACLFKIRASNAFGSSRFSAQSLLLNTLPAEPEPPTQFNMSKITNNSDTLKLSWQAPSDDGGAHVESYEIQYRKVSDDYWNLVSKKASNTSLYEMNIEQLSAFTWYIARIRAINHIGTSAWSTITPKAKTASQTSLTYSAYDEIPVFEFTVLTEATSRIAANHNHELYINGVGNGGIQNSIGDHGAAIIRPYTLAKKQLPDIEYYYMQGPQIFDVPQIGDDIINYIEVYLWAAGGGGAEGPDSVGGGGGYAAAPISVFPGDRLEIIVGGGGGPALEGRSGVGGYNGGGNGGLGDFGGGGGGGATVLRLNSEVIMIAAGGGGAGSSAYCCAFGGGGGGSMGLTGGIVENAHDDSLNTDRGLAPNADFSRVATGGVGGSLKKGGQPGISGSYHHSFYGGLLQQDVVPTFAVLDVQGIAGSHNASSGTKWQGGRGANGRKAGGGGGGGLFGGGGGGSSVDGAGGGGGSGVIDYTKVHSFFQRWNHAYHADDQPVILAHSTSTATEIHVSWRHSEIGLVVPITGFSIEASIGAASEDFQVVGYESSGATSSIIQRLTPNTMYRIRVKSMSSIDVGLYSNIVLASTLQIPANKWQHVFPRFLRQDTLRGGSRYVDPPHTGKFQAPCARRGHSLSQAENYLFLFGGFQAGYACERGVTSTCLIDNGFSNELWRLDSVTHEWMHIVPFGATWPNPREMHSGSTMDGNLIIFGGRTSINGNTEYLNDLWELAIEKPKQLRLSDMENDVILGEGRKTYTTGVADIDKGWCVTGIVVKLDMDVPCLQNLRIELLGPGPTSYPLRNEYLQNKVAAKEDITWTNDEPLHLRDRANTNVPTARYFPVELFSRNGESRQECVSGRRTMQFSDQFTTNLPGYNGDFSGKFKPFSTMQVFEGMPAGGNWTLAVHDVSGNAGHGILKTWDLKLDVRKCIPSYSWHDLSSNVQGTPPTSRFAHSAIVVDTSLFVFGGQNALLLNDLYRLDYIRGNTGNKWTKLSPTSNFYEKRYRSLLLTPFQFLGFGGIRNTAITAKVDEEELDNRLWRGKLLHTKNRWQQVVLLNQSLPKAPIYYRAEITPGSETQVQQQIENTLPSERYSTAMAYMKSGDWKTSPGNVVYLFGGYDGYSLFNDLWKLSLRGLEYDNSNVDHDHDRICKPRENNNAVANYWESSCAGDFPSMDCTINTIFLHAFCNKDYQTIQNI